MEANDVLATSYNGIRDRKTAEVWVLTGHQPLKRIAGADPGFLSGEGAKVYWWPYMGLGCAIFDIRKHIFATFQDVYCHIMIEWCWTTIQGTPVSLLSALERRNPRLRRGSLRPRGEKHFGHGNIFTRVSWSILYSLKQKKSFPQNPQCWGCPRNQNIRHIATTHAPTIKRYSIATIFSPQIIP